MVFNLRVPAAAHLLNRPLDGFPGVTQQIFRAGASGFIGVSAAVVEPDPDAAAALGGVKPTCGTS